jgi:hypothetical protein
MLGEEQMIFRREKMSDEEYVESVRKLDKQLRRGQWLWPVLLIFMFCFLFYLGSKLPDLMDLVPNEKKMKVAGMILGAIFGFALMQTAYGVGIFIKHWMEARNGFRTERLMLKYHDEVVNKQAPNHV